MAAISISAERLAVILDAAYEIDAMALLLVELSSGEQVNYRLRGIAARIASANGVVMSGIDDELYSTAALSTALLPPGFSTHPERTH